MGTCCGPHLETKVREYIPNAKKGTVTVQPFNGNPRLNENPDQKCDFCSAPAEFVVSYYPK